MTALASVRPDATKSAHPEPARAETKWDDLPLLALAQDAIPWRRRGASRRWVTVRTQRDCRRFWQLEALNSFDPATKRDLYVRFRAHKKEEGEALITFIDRFVPVLGPLVVAMFVVAVTQLVAGLLPLFTGVPQSWSRAVDVAFWAVLFLAVPVMLTAVLHIARRQSPRIAYGHIAGGLCRVLADVETAPNRWGTREFQRQISRELLRTAFALETGLPAALSSEDAGSRGWLKAESQARAAALRALATWVLFPKQDTRTHFLTRVRDDLVHATMGQWDALPRADAAAQRRAFVARAWEFTRRLIASVIPLMVLLVYKQQLAGSSAPAIYDALLFPFMLLPALVVTFALSDDVRNAFPLLKDTASMISGSAKKGD